MKKKEKTYVFRKIRGMECPVGSLSEAELKAKIIEESLSHGYIPGLISFEVVNFLRYRITCMNAYAGKKQARIIYESRKIDFNGVNRISIPNFKK